MTFAVPLLLLSAVAWEHPAGMITDQTITEIREKASTQSWAADLLENRREMAQAWADRDFDEVRRVFPRIGGNVYHNFSCPKDRVRLSFDLFSLDQFTCGTCEATYAPDTDAGIYPPGDRYHGDMYAGWVCLFHNALAHQMVDLALVGRMDIDAGMKQRAVDLLLLYAEVLPTLPLRVPESINQSSPMRRQYNRILTYHREGDNTILYNLAQAYELVRDTMSEAQRTAVETHVLARLLDDMMLEKQYEYDHNNVYQWHRTVVQAALALEREEVIDWAFGFGDYSPENLPEHRSMNRILATHFNADGAFWELASGYHLYPVQHLCEFAVLSKNVAAMDPARFPPERYDLTRKDSDGGQVIHRALTWFLSMAMPDRSMTIIGDSTKARAGMDNYTATAEIGYRYYDLLAVGDYERFRSGRRSRHGLLFGAPEIRQHDLPYTSSNLSSGWVSLRNAWKENQLWVGLNALIKGGGHQHADHLTLTLYSHGELLALEKSVPYNQAELRVLGTLTPAHNTVTIDTTSGPQGETLTPEQTPKVAYFHDGPVVKFAEIHGDELYEQATIYRRSVAVIEDIVVDLFRVEGGSTHDWIVNHAGSAPEFSLEMSGGAFSPLEWLTGGTGHIQTATTDARWSVKWQENDVTSRVTLLGAPGTEVYGLETYPLNNAVITDRYPPTQTLCVRRTEAAPFLAVWDSWTDGPNLVNLERATDHGEALRITTQAHVYHVVIGGGAATFSDGTHIDSDGVLTVVKDGTHATVIGGTKITIGGGGNTFRMRWEQPASMTVARGNSPTFYPDVMHDTYGGADHPRPAPEITDLVEEGVWPKGESR